MSSLIADECVEAAKPRAAHSRPVGRLVRTTLVCSLCFGIFSLKAESQIQRNNIPGDTLAIVDSWPITTRDLAERIELMPFETKTEEHDFESIKRKAVESLVGEHLLSLTTRDTPDPAQWRYVRTVLLKMFARDAMYKHEIRGRISIRDSEVRLGMRRYTVRRKVLAFHPPSVKEAQHLESEWKRRRAAGEPPDENLFSSSPYRFDTLIVPFGSIDSTLESAAFNLKKPFDISDPVPSQIYGLLTVVFLNDEPDQDAAGKSLEDRRTAVRQIIQQRKEGALAQSFVDGVLHGRSMAADTGVFRVVVRTLWELMRSDTMVRRVPRGFRYLPDDVYSLMSSFLAKLDTPIVKETSGALPLGEFLQSLFHYDFTIPSFHPHSFSVSLFQILRSMTEADLVAREALRRGYQYDPDVLRDVSVWTDYWKSRNAEFSSVDTVTMQEWEPYWSLWRYNTEWVERCCRLSAQEILRPDSLSSLSALNALHEGGDMDSLASLLSIRAEWRENGGRSGWFRLQDRKELAEKLMKMPLGEPRAIKLREGYAVLKLLGRRFDGDSTSIDSVVKREVKRVRLAHQQAAVNQVVAHAAVSRNVEIFYDRIKAADIVNVNMVTRRNLGFGGKLNAAPVLIPQWQWVDEWKQMRAILQ